jgi:copper(I)-binding protein
MSNLLSSSQAFALRGAPSFCFQQRIGLAMLTLLLLLACIPATLAHEFKVGDLEIGHPWSRATPPGAKVAGGYLTVTNKGSAPDRLLSISSDISDKAELHEMAVKDGVMIMRPVSGGLEIPAGGKVALKPGAYHLMFTGLKRQPKQGEKFSATLTFEKAGSVKVEFLVEGMGETGDMEMDHSE